MSPIVFLTSDLMFSSQVLGAAATLGQQVAMVARPADLAGKLAADSPLLLIDLTLAGLDVPAAIATVRAAAPRCRVVAYGAHVNEEALAAAQAAGADLVLSRGQFHKQYVQLLREATTRP